MIMRKTSGVWALPTLSPHSVTHGLMPSVYVLNSLRKKEVDDRDRVAITPVFDGLCQS
jgi:hypothetical protein